MPKGKKNKLWKAVKTIAKECEKHKAPNVCEECPFGDHMGVCMITKADPDKWKFQFSKIVDLKDGID